MVETRSGNFALEVYRQVNSSDPYYDYFAKIPSEDNGEVLLKPDRNTFLLLINRMDLEVIVSIEIEESDNNIDLCNGGDYILSPKQKTLVPVYIWDTEYDDPIIHTIPKDCAGILCYIYKSLTLEEERALDKGDLDLMLKPRQSFTEPIIRDPIKIFWENSPVLMEEGRHYDLVKRGLDLNNQLAPPFIITFP